MKIVKKALAYVGCWLLIILAFAALIILVGPFLVAALFVELTQKQEVAVVTEALASGEQP